MADLQQTLADIPDARPTEDLEAAIADSVRYLGSDVAMRSLDADSYWPKWHSPWWHMLLLWELGEAKRIPDRAVTRMIEALNALPIKIFPIHPEDAPGADQRETACHCALGSIYQVLWPFLEGPDGVGVDLDAALPWIKPWFPRYQMADGGLNCDGDAYLVEGECPSSMVGTVAAFEAMSLGRWSPEQQAFLERGASFLIDRKLMLGSPTVHNAAERERTAGWLALCFPRFYHYDVLRGLAALVRWAELSGRSLPRGAIEAVIAHLAGAFRDGVVRIQRHGFAICPTTRRQTATGEWAQDQPTSSFPLLDAVSAIGQPSAALTRQWAATRRGLLRLVDSGRVVD